MARFVVVLSLLAASVLAFSGHAATADPAQSMKPPDSAVQHKLLLQVSDADPATWSLALANARNVQSAFGARNVDIEIVAYGPGLRMLVLESPMSERVRELIAAGVRVVACENTMQVQKLSRDDMLPSLDYVRAGVVEVVLRQQQGYAYVRP